MAVKGMRNDMSQPQTVLFRILGCSHVGLAGARHRATDARHEATSLIGPPK